MSTDRNTSIVFIRYGLWILVSLIIRKCTLEWEGFKWGFSHSTKHSNAVLFPTQQINNKS